MNDFYIKRFLRSVLDQFLSFFVEDDQEHVLATHFRDLDCFFQNAPFPLAVSDISRIFVGNKSEGIYFLFAHTDFYYI